LCVENSGQEGNKKIQKSGVSYRERVTSAEGRGFKKPPLRRSTKKRGIPKGVPPNSERRDVRKSLKKYAG